ncbi:hypothetical protein KY289_030959 [Solanum tuberosum]|nr:hypothetical protein KY289_030959 [Solanum tuberosum]
MSPSVARGARNLRILDIKDCDSMEEMITKEEQKGEGIMTLFPLYVLIDDCPEMKTFVKQGIFVSTPSLASVNNDDEEQSTGDGNEVGPSYDKLVMSMNPKLARKKGQSLKK